MNHSPAPLADGSDWNRFWSGQARTDGPVSWSKRRILKVLDPHLLPGARVLDAGCGSGFFSEFFCGRGMTVTALDYADQALELTRRRTGDRAALVRMDMLTEPLSGRPGAPFDLIFTDGLFEHFSPSQQDAILQNFLSVLAPGGRIITFVPNRWSPWELIRPWFMPGIDEKPFVLSGLRDLHVRNGLKILADGGVNTFPFRISPDRWLGRAFGMLLFVETQKL